MKRALLFLCMVATTYNVAVASAAGRDTLTVNETDLRPFESHEEVLLTLSRPLYRLGEILELGNGGGYVVAIDYHWQRNHWEYTVCPVRVGTKPTRHGG
jgi:hypothetical protein